MNTHFNNRARGRVRACLVGAALSIGFLASPALAQLAGQVVAGSDNGRNARVIKTDSSGRIEVVGAAAGGVAYGPDAPGGAGTQSPVRIGGSTSATSNAGTVYNWVVTSAGSGQVIGPFTNGVTGTGGSNNGLLVGGTDGTNYRHLNVDTTGRLNVLVPGMTFTSTGMNVGGNVASGSADSGNPVKIGGVYRATSPSFTDGQRGDLQIGARGSLSVQLCAVDSLTCFSNSSPGDGGGSVNGLPVTPRALIYNGASYDRQRTIQGADGTGLGVTAVATAPTSHASAGIAATTGTGSGVVFKASAGNLYRARVTVPSAGYLHIYNSTAVPADGAVSPRSCTQIPAGTTEVDWSEMPQYFSAGVAAVFSSTGCTTKTAVTGAFFEGFVQ